nr:transposase [Nitrosomonas cryotolerans]
MHAGMRCAMNQRKELEYLCRYITRPGIANKRLTFNGAGQVKGILSGWHSTSHYVTVGIPAMPGCIGS